MYNGTNYGALTMKVDSSGVIQWQKWLYGASAFAYGIAVDSSGNVFIAGGANVTNPYPMIAKYNSSGTLQWQKYLAGTGSGNFSGITVDSSGNPYAVGVKGNVSSIVKYDTSGNITWQRTFLTGGNNEAVGVAIGPGTSIYVVGGVNPIGVYGEWTYGVPSAFTNTDLTYTDTTPTINNNANANSQPVITLTVNELYTSQGVPV
jgi:hypothetical protein